MKNLLIIFVFILFFSCDNTTYNLSHHPDDYAIIKYTMTLESDQTEMKQNTKFTITKNSDNNYGIETLITKLKLYQIDGHVKRVQHFYDDYVNEPMYFEMDTVGNTQQGVSYEYLYDPKEVFDVTNYFITFPDEPIQLGDSWETRVGSFAMDGISKIKTYTLTSVTPDMIYIDEETEYSSGPGNNYYGSTQSSFGNYTIDRKTGYLIKAYITLYTSVGRETSVGQISISKY